jgi:hypothetical protein
MAWAKEELRGIAEADDLHVAPFREDGMTYGTPTWIWSVVVDGSLYVRLALQVAAQHALELAERPDKDEMLELAERWRPWRGVAARLLWAYYAALKTQRTAVPV